MVTGFGAEIGFLVMGAIGLAIGVGVLELHGWARIAGLIWVLVGLVVTTTMWLVPGAYVKVMQSASRIPDLAVPHPALGYHLVLMSVGIGAGIVQLYFLWTRKAAFHPPAPAAVAVEVANTSGPDDAQ